MTLNERLDELAERGDGQITIGTDAGQDLEAFQATVALLKDYESSGYLIIVGEPHNETSTGHRYIDSVRVRLTDAGIEWRKESHR